MSCHKIKYSREETEDINETPARELSAIIIDSLSLLQDHPFAHGEKYFDLEDELTQIINDYFKAIEQGE